MRKITYWLASVLVAGCGNGQNAKVATALDAGLLEHAPCVEVTFAMGKNAADGDGALSRLVGKGYVTQVTSAIGPIYEATETGRPLIVKGHVFHCFRTGRFQATTIEAVDLGNDMTGTPVATVRARIKFIPEDWTKDTAGLTSWKGFWDGVKDAESHAWLYTMTKSGDAYFYTGRAKQIN
jgi:hypothetical protein